MISCEPNYLMPFIIFIVAYVAMAWYDHMYNCDDKLMSGKYGVAAPFDSFQTPQLRKVPNPGAAPDQEAIYERNVYLFHSLLALPLFMFVAYRAYTHDPAYKSVYMAGMIIAGLGWFYHIFRLFYPREMG